MPPKGTIPAADPDTTDPTKIVQDPPADDTPADVVLPSHVQEVMDAYKEQLMHSSRETARLRAELEKKDTPPPVVEKELTPDDEKKFFDKPITTMREMIKEEVQASVKNVNDFTANLQREKIIDTAKNQMRNNPSQFPYIDIKEVEGYLDQLLAGIPKLDANNIVLAYNTAVGYAVSNGVELTKKTVDGNEPPPNRKTTVPPNPHVRPTPPAPPAPAGGKKLRALTEAEKKIARFNKMTDEEFVIWTDGVSGSEVAHITDEEIGKRAVAAKGGK